MALKPGWETATMRQTARSKRPYWAGIKQRERQVFRGKSMLPEALFSGERTIFEP